MSGTSAVPRYLYHYTSVDTLELILSNRTFRFNPLTNMDDQQEQWNAHGKAHGHFWFISSWTEEEEEIKDMWQQYCRPDATRGIRIKLPVNPFSHTENKLGDSDEASLKELIGITYKYYIKYYGKTPENFDEHAEMAQRLGKEHPEAAVSMNDEMRSSMRCKVVCYPKNVDGLLTKVEYTDEHSKLYPVMVGNYQGFNFEDDSVFCRYKNTSWAWQKEWRYSMHFQRMIPGKIKSGNTIELYELPFDYYDLKLDKNKLKELEIVTSPVISEDAKKKLSDILDKYCPTAIVEPSQLRNIDK